MLTTTMKVIKIINNIGYVLIGLMILFLAVMKLPGVCGYGSYCILSGSMEPQIPVGSVVYVKDVAWEELAPGDCITFRLGTGTQLTGTHRIVSIDSQEKEITTKGDANPAEDIMKVRENSLIGKVVYSLPLLGYGAWFLQTTAGKITCAAAFLMALIPAKKRKARRGNARRTAGAGRDAAAGNGAEKKSADKKKNIILNVIIVIILLLMLLLIWELGKVLFGYAQSRREYEELRRVAVMSLDFQDHEAGGMAGTTPTDRQQEASPDAVASDEAGKTEGSGDTAGDTTPTGETTEPAQPVCSITVDFETLWQTNQDIIGWLYLESLDISYPIVQAQDNEKYLYTSVKGTANSAGSIFVDAWNHADFGDPHTIVYGHNMKNGSMFGSLKKLKNQETVDQFTEEAGGSLGFWIITPREQYYYQIFSIHTVASEGDTYALFPQSDEQFLNFVNTMAKGTGITLPQREYTEKDRVVTLSTCTGNDAYRLVVQGIRSEN